MNGEKVHAVGTMLELKGELEKDVGRDESQQLGDDSPTDAEDQMEDLGVDRGPALRWITTANVTGLFARVLFTTPSSWKHIDLALPGEVNI